MLKDVKYEPESSKLCDRVLWCGNMPQMPRRPSHYFLRVENNGTAGRQDAFLATGG